MATNLFAMPGTVGGHSGGGNKPLVEFKAGKMNYTESTRKVVPDKRKGLIQLVQTPDALMHFIWKDRTTGQAEPDLIIFPEDAVFKHVKQCTTGRVYLLEFKTSRKLFFWMQEASDAKDQEYCNKINEYINNPPSGAEPAHGGGGGMPSGMDQNALLQMFSQRAQQARGSSGGGSSAPVVGMGDLQNILTQIGMPSSAISGMLGRQGQQAAPSQRAQPAAAQPASQPASQPAQQARAPRLSTLLNADAVRTLLSNPAIQERLLPYLPPERRTPEEFRDILSSPQFQQSLDAFGDALESGQLSELVRQFGLPASGSTSIQQFLQAVQAQAQQQGGQQGGDKKPDQKDDDKMDTK